MGKNKKKSQKKATSKASKSGHHQEEIVKKVTMEALEQMSDDDDEVPPEDEWTAEARALRDTIKEGAFDKLLERNGQDDDDDDSSFEEADLEDESESEGEEKQAEEEQESSENEVEDSEQEDSSSSEEEEEEDKDNTKQAVEEQVASDDDGEQSEEEEEEGKASHLEKKNELSSKALQVVTEELVASKKGMPWVETFDIVPPTPLPFGTDKTKLDIHDDLKREVAFYDTALEAVLEARTKCKESGVPFSRPDDFFAEMVKTDDHMAKVKDRLIFEKKKIDAVAQRKSNKELKLRAKEARANKVAEKAKRKKEHFKAVEEWASAAKRGLGNDDNAWLDSLNGKKGPNKKRQAADRKYGFGGKRGRFKQTDPKMLNDMSGFNPRGNFAGGMKATAKRKSAGGSGAARKGKRARDASRARK